MLRYLPPVLVVAFTLFCVFDVLGSDDRTRRGVPRPAWLLVVVALPVVGGVVWLVVSRLAARTPGRAAGPIAPDDDPEFLFRLDQERRRREQQQRREASAADTGAAADDTGAAADDTSGGSGTTPTDGTDAPDDAPA